MKKLLMGICLTAGLVAACLPKGDVQQNPPDYWPTAGWRTSTPEAQGIDSRQLAKAIEPLIGDPSVNLHSLLIIRNGYIVAEYYAPPHTAETLHNLHSTTKSFTGTLAGIAVTQKKLKVDRKVLSFFPEQTFDNMNDWKKRMTVRHLLTMGSGIDWAENFFEANRESPMTTMYQSDNWVKVVLDRKVITRPGMLFNYNSGGSHVLAVIITRAVGQPLKDFARENFFSPLGITDYVWYEDPQGIPAGGTGLHLCPRDMAKLGFLYLNDGIWENRRLLSKRWIKEATTDYFPGGEIGYGYQFWIFPGGYYSNGSGGQHIFVFPEKELLVITTAETDYINRDSALYSFWKEGMPAIVSDTPLPENPEGDRFLQEILLSRSVEKPIPLTVPPVMSSLTGRKIVLNRNTLGFTSLTILGFHDQLMDIEIGCIDPSDNTEKTAVYTVGMDHCYLKNGYKGFPLSIAHVFPALVYHYPDPIDVTYAFRGYFPDGNTLAFDYLIPGSLVSLDMTLEVKEDDIWFYYSWGKTLKGYKIKGRI